WSGHARVGGRDWDVARRPIADGLAARPSRVSVEDRGEEDGRPAGVEVEDLGSVRGQPESMILGPGPDLIAATLEDRDVQGVDADLQDHLGVTRGGRGTERESLWSRRISFPDEALQGPVAAALDLGGDAWQRDDGAELPAAARELERRDVVLDAVVVGGECGGAEQVD